MPTIKIKVGKYMLPIHLEVDGKRIWLTYGFNKEMTALVKLMKGAKWHGFEDPPIKKWSISNCARNLFQLQALQFPSDNDPRNPYYKYNQPLLEVNPRRAECRAHQVQMFRGGVTYKQDIWAAEMGVGKTLALIEVLEHADVSNAWYIAPKSAMYSAMLEFDKWKALKRPKFYTYEGLKQILENWPEGADPPQFVAFDESSRLKNHHAQRTQAAQHLADSMRECYGDNCYIIEMSGSPAPKSPVDWWSQTEIACPGFLKEGSPEKFREGLALITKEEAMYGGTFPKIKTWWDDSNKCQECGEPKEREQHDPDNLAFGEYHAFKESVNQVNRLYKRLKGLVEVIFKKDCLELPEKIHTIIECEPSLETKNLAKLVLARASSTAQALILLRELSDGFQYQMMETGNREQCPVCFGDKTTKAYFDGDEQIDADRLARLLMSNQASAYEVTIPCDKCFGEGVIDTFKRETVEIKTPKEGKLLELLDQHEEYQRFIVYAGFKGSVDRVCRIVEDAGWEYIRADGRGWYSPTMPGLRPEQMIQVFQDYQANDRKIVFVGHPKAAGMGITLTASPSIAYWSNDFDAESRLQSMARIDRFGSRGINIFDLCHLPIDKLIIKKLDQKIKIQNMSLGELRLAYDEVTISRDTMI